ncbi:hypothetical protein CEXT_375751 [Caerostris extrusa]|uniref:Uncharacterized protein n=1 Tax=Caerostris extrusa TaxID=172846 RepID=A0AAV4QZ21_CAEEX|nr:hypothetical protein CEXT_375751 [Caerostris extrusa]
MANREISSKLVRNSAIVLSEIIRDQYVQPLLSQSLYSIWLAVRLQFKWFKSSNEYATFSIRAFKFYRFITPIRHEATNMYHCLISVLTEGIFNKACCHLYHPRTQGKKFLDYESNDHLWNKNLNFDSASSNEDSN